MAYTSIKNQEGNYEIFNDGQRIATGSESVLQNYGLSPTNLTSSANIPQDSITSDVLSGGSEQQINLPTLAPEPDYLASINSIISQNLQPEEDQQGDDISKGLLDITQKLGGQTAAQIKAEETAGLPGFQKQLTDVNAQLQTLVVFESQE